MDSDMDIDMHTEDDAATHGGFRIDYSSLRQGKAGKGKSKSKAGKGKSKSEDYDSDKEDSDDYGGKGKNRRIGVGEGRYCDEDDDDDDLTAVWYRRSRSVKKQILASVKKPG